MPKNAKNAHIIALPTTEVNIIYKAGNRTIVINSNILLNLFLL